MATLSVPYNHPETSGDDDDTEASEQQRSTDLGMYGYAAAAPSRSPFPFPPLDAEDNRSTSRGSHRSSRRKSSGYDDDDDVDRFQMERAHARRVRRESTKSARRASMENTACVRSSHTSARPLESSSQLLMTRDDSLMNVYDGHPLSPSTKNKQQLLRNDSLMDVYNGHPQSPPQQKQQQQQQSKLINLKKQISSKELDLAEFGIFDTSPTKLKGTRRGSLNAMIYSRPRPEYYQDMDPYATHQDNNAYSPNHNDKDVSSPPILEPLTASSAHTTTRSRRASLSGAVENRHHIRSKSSESIHLRKKQNHHHNHSTPKKKTSGGFNLEALARMNRHTSHGTADDDEDDESANRAYGYAIGMSGGTAQSKTPSRRRSHLHPRRPSAASSSASSRRRRSSKQPSHHHGGRSLSEVVPVQVESDLDSEGDESITLTHDSKLLDSNDSDGTAESSMLDYVRPKLPKSAARSLYESTIGFESDSDKSEGVSVASQKQMERRNSSIHANNKNDATSTKENNNLQTTKSSNGSNDLLWTSDDNLADDEEEDLQDPESILRKSTPPQEAPAAPKEANTTPVKPFRKKPFTTARPEGAGKIVRLPVDKDEVLIGSLKAGIVDGSTLPTHTLNRTWGDLDFDDDQTSGKSSSVMQPSEIYGASMHRDTTYKDDDVVGGERVRRHESLQAGFIDMEELLKQHDKNPSSKTSSSKSRKSRESSASLGKEASLIPIFKPSEGCKNASDFIVRCFAARLRTGITVLKHHRSRFSKSQYRILYLLADGKTLSWKPLEGEKVNGSKRPKLDLTLCNEVRHAWSSDPRSRKRNGTSILRARAKDDKMSAKSLSLIFRKRTFDMTALSTDLCKVLLEGFSALCFRLQMEKLKQKHNVDKDDEAAVTASDDNVSLANTHSDEWASTVYGQSTVSISMSVNTNVTPVSPWGL